MSKYQRAAGGKAADIAGDAGFEPVCLKLLESGELKERARLAEEHLAVCDLCPGTVASIDAPLWGAWHAGLVSAPS